VYASQGEVADLRKEEDQIWVESGKFKILGPGQAMQDAPDESREREQEEGGNSGRRRSSSANDALLSLKVR